jgi:putative DNA primase/helicase
VIASNAHLRPIDGHRLDAADFFAVGANGRPKFVAPRLSRALAAQAPYAVGGELLHRYSAGAYRPEGERRARARIVEILGDEWTRSRSDEVLAHLRDGSPSLLECPPFDIVNCTNGLLDVRAGTLAPHDPDLLSPVQIGAAYDPAAGCPTVRRFLEDVLPDDARAVFLELAAYLVTPDNRLQRATMLLGSGQNGKSVAANLLEALLGPHNVSAIPLHKLDEDRFAVASLYGRLANIFADLDARALRSSSIFKSITGGDRIEAERKFRPSFAFRPYSRLVFSANAVPPTSDSSDGFFRRWVILPFECRIEHPDRSLSQRLATPGEMSGVLNEALPLLSGLRDRGDFAKSDTVDRAGQAFRTHADSVSGFLDEQCVTAPDAQIAKPRLAAAYRAWCSVNGRAPLSTARFNERLRGLADLQEIAISGVRLWRGIRTEDDAR